MPRGITSSLLGFWSSPKFSLQTSSSKGHGRVIQIVLYVIKRAWPCDSNCPLCDQEPETAPHLCVHCVFAQEVWFQLEVWSNDLVNRPEGGWRLRFGGHLLSLCGHFLKISGDLLQLC